MSRNHSTLHTGTPLKLTTTGVDITPARIDVTATGIGHIIAAAGVGF